MKRISQLQIDKITADWLVRQPNPYPAYNPDLFETVAQAQLESCEEELRDILREKDDEWIEWVENNIIYLGSRNSIHLRGYPYEAGLKWHSRKKEMLGE